MADEVRLTLRGEGPDWSTFRVQVDGKDLACNRVSMSIDPQTNECQVTIVTGYFEVELNEMVLTAPLIQYVAEG